MNQFVRRCCLLGLWLTLSVAVPARGEVILQLFNLDYEQLIHIMPELAEAGYGALWLPPPTKAGGTLSVGYDLWDPFDLGNKPLNDGRTRYGNKEELLRMIQTAHRFGIRIYFDNVMNHRAFAVPGFDEHTPLDLYPGMHPEDFHLHVTEEGFYRKWGNTRDWHDEWQVIHLGLSDLIDISHESPNQNFGAEEGDTHPKIHFVRHPDNPEYYAHCPEGHYIGFGNVTQAMLDEHPDAYEEEVTEYLTRAMRWKMHVTRADGLRLDAVKHVPAAFFGQMEGDDKAYSTDGYVGAMQKQFNLTRGFTDTNLRDTVFDTELPRDDAMVFGEHLGAPPPFEGYIAAGMRLKDAPLRDHINSFLGEYWGNLTGMDQEGFGNHPAVDHRTGVQFAHSHDSDWARLRDVQYAYYLARAGLPIVYSDGNFKAGTLRDAGGAFPRHANTAFLGQFDDPRLPNMVYVHEHFARGNQLPAFSDRNVAAFSRVDRRREGWGHPDGLEKDISDADAAVLLFIMNHSTNVQYRSFPTAFPPGAYLYQYARSPETNGMRMTGFYITLEDDGSGQGIFPATVPIPPQSYYAFSWRSPEPSLLWERKAGSPITIYQDGEVAETVHYIRRDGPDGDPEFNPHNLPNRGFPPDVTPEPFRYRHAIPRVTSAENLRFVARVDGSATRVLMKLNGGIDLNSQMGLGGHPEGGTRDRPPGLTTDTFLGWEDTRFVERFGPEGTRESGAPIFPDHAEAVALKRGAMTVWEITDFNARTVEYYPHNDWGETVVGLPDGFHFIQARAFLERGEGAPIFNTFKQTFYLDLERAQGEWGAPLPGTAILQQGEEIVVRADATTSEVWIQIDEGDWQPARRVHPSPDIQSDYPREFRYVWEQIPATGQSHIRARLLEISSSTDFSLSDVDGHFTTLEMTVYTEAPESEVVAVDETREALSLNAYLTRLAASPDTDHDGLPDLLETMRAPFPDVDAEFWSQADVHRRVMSGRTDPQTPATDGTALPDGLQLGLTAPVRAGATDLTAVLADGTPAFLPDLDPPIFNTLDNDWHPQFDFNRPRTDQIGGSMTDPTNPDSDGDGLTDCMEDLNRNGRVDIGLLDANGVVTNIIEWPHIPTIYNTSTVNRDALPANAVFLETDPNNPDTDGDGLLDGEEDINQNGRVDLALLYEDGRWEKFIVDPDNHSGYLLGMNLPGIRSRALNMDKLFRDFGRPRKIDGVWHDRDKWPRVLFLETDPLNPDTNGDGLPDGWKVRHGLDPWDDGWYNLRTGTVHERNSHQGPSGDLTGDGIDNLKHFLGGTDPRELIPVAPPSPALQIGPGALRGMIDGEPVREAFTGWSQADVRAYDYYHGDGVNVEGGDVFRGWEDHDTSRDLIAFYTRDGGDPERDGDGRFYFRVDLYDLQPDAEFEFVDIYVAIDIGNPEVGERLLPNEVDTLTDMRWEVVVAVHDNTNGMVFVDLDHTRNTRTYGDDHLEMGGVVERPDYFAGAYFSSAFDAVEFAIDRRALLDAKWNGYPGSLNFQVFTTKPGTCNNCVDGAPGPGDIGGRSDIRDSILNDYIAEDAHWKQAALRGAGGVLREWIRGYDAPLGQARVAMMLTGESIPAAVLEAHEVLGLPYNVPGDGIHWPPSSISERSDLDLLAADGYRIVVLDQDEHLVPWFGRPQGLGANGWQIREIGGLTAIAINSRFNAFLSRPHDEGPALLLRRLHSRASRGDPDHLIVLHADAQDLADPDVAAAYIMHLQWVANRPWVRFVDLNVP